MSQAPRQIPIEFRLRSEPRVRTTVLTTSASEIARAEAQARWVTVTRFFRLIAPASSLRETPKERDNSLTLPGRIFRQELSVKLM